MTIISSPGAMLFKIDTSQSIFQCQKGITEIIIIYYIKLQYIFIVPIVVIQSQVLSDSLRPQQSLDCSTPGSSILIYLPEFAQIHVHLVRDAITRIRNLYATDATYKIDN